jgi:hypothetical protein
MYNASVVVENSKVVGLDPDFQNRISQNSSKTFLFSSPQSKLNAKDITIRMCVGKLLFKCTPPTAGDLGCQIFLDKIYQNGEKYTKISLN